MIELPLDPLANKTGDIWHMHIKVALLLGFLHDHLFFMGSVNHAFQCSNVFHAHKK